MGHSDFKAGERVAQLRPMAALLSASCHWERTAAHGSALKPRHGSCYVTISPGAFS